MGIAIPQVVTEDRASGALVIDGSLNFNQNAEPCLTRSLSSSGNRSTWTVSFWAKLTPNTTTYNPLFMGTTDNMAWSYEALLYANSNFYYIDYISQGSGVNVQLRTNDNFRDSNGWYHIVVQKVSNAGGIKLYVNNRLLDSFSSNTNSGGQSTHWNTSGATQSIGNDPGGQSTPNSQMSQFYFIDGQALGPEEFGFTDPLTNTWRPKKYTGTFTTSSVNNGTNWTQSLSATSGTLSNGSNAFDGDVSTRAQTANAGSGKELTFAPPAINFTTSLEVYCDQGSSVPTATWNGNTVNPGGGAWVTVYSGSGELSSTYPLVINTQGAAQFATLKAVRIDGEILIDNLNATGVNSFYLPMDGNSPIGQDQAPSPNDGTVWSSGWSGTVLSGYNKEESFDGIVTQNGNNCTRPDTGQTLTWTNPKTSTPFTTLRLWCINDGGSAIVRVNGNDVTSQVGGAGYSNAAWYTITSVGSALQTIELVNVGGYSPFLWGVEVDGVVLVDGQIGNSWTPVNFGGSVALDRATGARPILNTTQGGNTASPGVFGSNVSKIYAVTVASVDGGNRYHFDGVDRPNPTLIRGATYTFDQSDSSNGGGGTHPLRFATAADAAGSTQYTNGVATNGTPGQAGAYTKITVPHDAPDTLYYYCTNHGGMGSSTVQITDETKADPYASNCVLAMPLIADKEDVSASIACTSTTKTITSNGDPAASTLDSNFYGGSFEFDGTDDCLTSSDCGSGATQYTMECWFNTDNFNASQRPINMSQDLNGNRYLYAEITTAKKLQIREESTGSAVSANAVFAADKWHHVAVSYDGVRLRGFVDGVFVVQTAANGSPVASGNTMKMRVGADESNASANEFDGHIQDVRVYFGACKYTATNIGDQAFIVPATNPDILPDTPSGVATKSKLKKVTDGAVVFDGTGDEVNVPGHSDLAFGTGSFTIECFAYFNSFDDTYPTVLSKLVGSTLSWIVRVKNDGKVVWYSKNGSGTNNESSTTPIGLKRWHHIAVVREGTGTDQLKVYVDGTAVLTMTDSNDYNDNSPLCIGTQQAGGGNTINGFISNVRIVKGTALYTGNFPPPGKKLANVTNTKLLCCQSPTSATTADVIPTGSITVAGNAAATNFNPFNTDINTVRGQETGYATWNPLDIQGLDSGDLKDGNLSITHSAADWLAVRANKFVSSGKWYYEVKVGNNQYTTFGVGSVDYNLVPTSNDWCNVANVYGFYPYNGKVYDAATGRSYATADTSAAGNVYGIAIDMDNKSLRFYENGRDLGVAFDSTTATNFVNKESVAPMAWLYNQSGTDEYNFGQKPFKFPPPDGFQPLSASSLRPDTVIPRSDQYVSTTRYTGNGASSPGGSGGTQTIDVGHKPDLIWIKDLTQSHNHNLLDSIRGPGSILMSDSNVAPVTDSTDAVTAFTDTGFTLGDNGEGTQSLELNKDGNNYIAWTWKAGGAPTADNTQTSGAMTANSVSLDDVLQSAYTPSGSPTKYPLEMSIGTNQGFSIVKHQGTGGSISVPHGLQQAPTFMAMKSLDNVQSWSVYTTVIDGSHDYLHLNSTAAKVDSSYGAPTNSVFYRGSADAYNENKIVYLWHDVPGLQKFGTYEGIGGTANGPFVELGFRPAIVWVKNVDNPNGNSHWCVFDNLRPGYNKSPAQNRLHLDENVTEDPDRVDDGQGIDILSNGFRVRSNNWYETNLSGNTYIYCAWAEAPAFNLFGAQSNAR